VNSQLSFLPAAPVERIGPLTTLRFVAALLVVMYHTLPRGQGGERFEQLGTKFVDLGFTAVGLFFVLSGFILSTVYPKLDGRDGIIRFAVARVARIVPVYAATLLMDLPRLLAWRIAKSGLVIGTLIAGGQFISQLLMLQAWFPPLGGLNFPSWSVATEAFFYAMFPLLLPYMMRSRGLGTSIALLVGFWLLGFAVALGPMLLFEPAPPWIDAMISHNPIGRLPEFASGIVLANIGLLLKTKYARATGGVRFLALILGLMGYFSVGLLQEMLPTSTLQNAALVPFYGLVILGMATREGIISRLISHPLLLLLGEASYALYLLHIPCWTAFLALGGKADTWAYAVYIVAAIGASLLLHVWFEKPMRRWVLVRWAGGRSAGVFEPAPASLMDSASRRQPLP
jgi:peptidoglycan/LPS O-acetylase OafA/YrhL